MCIRDSKKWGTKFGVTPILLGGYARVCGMEPGEMSPHLEPVLALSLIHIYGELRGKLRHVHWPERLRGHLPGHDGHAHRPHLSLIHI